MATNIFHGGLKKFDKEPAYALRYAKFLAHTNQDSRTFDFVPPSAAAWLWSSHTAIPFPPLPHCGATTDQRTLFESTLSVIPAAQAEPVWDAYVEFETWRTAGAGNLGVLAKVRALQAL